MHRFMVRTEVFYAEGALQSLRRPGVRKVLLIIDPMMKENGSGRLVESVFDSSTEFVYYTNIRPDPSIELLGDGVMVALDAKADFIVAVGGGSTIDAAKAIVYLYNKIAASLDPLFKRVKFAIIPTTSGTGSEVTNVSVITVDGLKSVLVNDEFLPDMAILDVNFTKSLPLNILADTSIDALTHAIEAYFSRKDSDCIDALCEKTVQLVFKYLPSIFINGDSIDARQHLHNAACIAGMAFTNAALGINHSMAHALGAAFHVPHGRANAVFLSTTIAYNAQVDYVKEKLRTLCVILGLGDNKLFSPEEEFITALNKLLGICGIPSSVKGLSLDHGEYSNSIFKLSNMALEDRCTPTNPRSADLDDLVALFSNAGGGK